MSAQQALEQRLRDDFHTALWHIFEKYSALTIRTNWQVLDKTYGEVGGRFLEDFLLSSLRANLDELAPHHIVHASAPAGRRTMEDLIVEWELPAYPRQRLLVSIKGHKAGSASNPNLVSLQKAKAFYAHPPENVHFLLVVVHYQPEKIANNGFHMHIQAIGVYHLKDLQERHLSLQTIGAGGQFLLNGIDDIQTIYRTPEAFYELLCRKETAWLARRG